MPTPTCQSCRHWMAPSDRATDRAGMCRKPALSNGFSGWRQTDGTDSCEDWTEIAYFRGSDGTIHVERRTSTRTTTDYPARLQTTGGDWSGRLVDISITGARLIVRNPPRQGVHALLRCGANEIFCKVAWSTGDACGIAFDRPVSQNLLYEVSGRTGAARESVADLSKIPAGRKREGLQQPIGQEPIAPPAGAQAEPSNVVSLEQRRPQPANPAEASFESRDADGYIKFYPFRAMANP